MIILRFQVHWRHDDLNPQNTLEQSRFIRPHAVTGSHTVYFMPNPRTIMDPVPHVDYIGTFDNYPWLHDVVAPNRNPHDHPVDILPGALTWDCDYLRLYCTDEDAQAIFDWYPGHEQNLVNFIHHIRML